MGEAAALAPEVTTFGADAAASGISVGAESGGLFSGIGDFFTGGSSLATYASVGGLALQGASSVLKGEGAKASGEAQAAQFAAEASKARATAASTAASDTFQADRADRAAAFGKVQADLTDTQYRDELTKTLGNIDVIRAAAHISPLSPTTAAVEDRQRELSGRQRGAAAFTARAQDTEYTQNATFLRAAAANALGVGNTSANYSASLGDYAKSLGGFNAAAYDIDAAAKIAGGLAKATA